MTYQEADMQRPGKRPRFIEVTSPRDGAYPEGLYILEQSSFRPNDYDRLTLSPYLKLIGLDEAIQLARAAEKTVRKPQKS